MKCWEESMVILVKETSPSNFLVNQISKNRRKWLEKVFSERYFTIFFSNKFYYQPSIEKVWMEEN